MHFRTSEEIKHAIERWESRHPDAPCTAQALERLAKKGLTSEEVAEKLSRLTLAGETAPPEVLASYRRLHAVDRLDEACVGFDLLGQPQLDMLRAIFQASEIALLNLKSLASRATEDIEAGRMDVASDKQAWMSSFQESLAALSQLSHRLVTDAEGRKISLHDSPHLEEYVEHIGRYRNAQLRAGLLEADSIGRKDRSDPGRYISFNDFTDTIYQKSWMANLGEVCLPFLRGTEEFDNRDFYEQFAGTDALDRAVNELQQRGDNFLTQFRAYHQMSEVFAGALNRTFADTIRLMTEPSPNLLEVEERLRNCAEMLEIIHDNVNPILRNMVPARYQHIRGSLGITSGSHSAAFESLFNTLHDLLAEAAISVVVEQENLTEAKIQAAASAIHRRRNRDNDANIRDRILQHILQIDDSVRAWRLEHAQYVRTELGTVPESTAEEGTPLTSASISGSAYAARGLYRMMEAAYERNPVKPLHKPLRGTAYPPLPSFDGLFHGSEYERTGCANTSVMVADLSGAVQQRVHRTSAGASNVQR